MNRPEGNGRNDADHEYVASAKSDQHFKVRKQLVTDFQMIWEVFRKLCQSQSLDDKQKARLDSIKVASFKECTTQKGGGRHWKTFLAIAEAIALVFPLRAGITFDEIVEDAFHDKMPDGYLGMAVRLDERDEVDVAVSETHSGDKADTQENNPPKSKQRRFASPSHWARWIFAAICIVAVVVVFTLIFSGNTKNNGPESESNPVKSGDKSKPTSTAPSADAREAILEKLNGLTADARVVSKKLPMVEWTLDELELLAINHDSTPLADTRKRLSQLEAYIAYMETVTEGDVTFSATRLAGLPTPENCLYAEISLLRGLILLRQESSPEIDSAAEAEFRAAYKLSTTDELKVEALLGWATALRRQGQTETALKKWDEALGITRRGKPLNAIQLSSLQLMKAGAILELDEPTEKKLERALIAFERFYKELAPGTLQQIAAPLQLVAVGNDLLKLGDDSKFRPRIDTLRAHNDSVVRALGNMIKDIPAGEEQQYSDSIEQFVVAVNRNIDDELTHSWPISNGQFQLAVEILNTPRLKEHVALKYQQVFEALQSSVSASNELNVLDAALKIAEAKRELARGAVQDIEQSVLSFHALRLTITVIEEMLNHDERADVKSQVELMHSDLNLISVLPANDRLLVATTTKRLTALQAQSPKDALAFDQLAGFIQAFDEHVFNFQTSEHDDDDKD